MIANSNLKRLLDKALDQQLDGACPGAILEITGTEFERIFSRALGLFSPEESGPLEPADGFRAASVTKTVTAAVAVRLAAEGHWKLDDPVTNWLPSSVAGSLLKLKGLSSPDALTIRRLLGHSSGLPDYFFDPGFQQQVREQPDRIWQPHELVEAAVKIGEMLFSPGTDFSYGDTAYVLVGIAIETILGCTLAEAYRSLVFQPLEMEATYLEWREPPRGSRLSHHFDQVKDLRHANLSFDWAGGGLVTNAPDLARFLRGLFGHALFDQRWLHEMLNWRRATRWRPHSSARYLHYGLGLGANIAWGQKIFGATGVWGAFAYYCPAADVTITGTLNRIGADRPAPMDAVIHGLIHEGVITGKA